MIKDLNKKEDEVIKVKEEIKSIKEENYNIIREMAVKSGDFLEKL